jgi:glucose-6-phosphate 1-dehydrogenase
VYDLYSKLRVISFYELRKYLTKREFMIENGWSFVIMGATGDLSRRKLFPALYALIKKGMRDAVIIGTGREDVDENYILERARPFIKNIEEEYWNILSDMLVYQKVSFDTQADYAKLREVIEREEKARDLPKKRLFYLATFANFYCQITELLVKTNCLEPHDTNQRIVYEKPFGWDEVSARSINACIKKLLSESQVYRIDHYLARELVSNILLIRFANTLFKKIWNAESIEAVRILFHEQVGVEGRGQFFDEYGALKDVLQNHVLQILALVAMQEPRSLDAEEVIDKKAQVLHKIRVDKAVLGQYEGYQQEEGVKPNSQTDTYAAVKLFIDQPEWHGVPFYLETGKSMASKNTSIELILKPVDYCQWSAHNHGSCEANKIIIHIAPEEGFGLRINTKKPGSQNRAVPVMLNFSYEALVGPASPEAYERLLEEIVAGNQSFVVRFDEIEYQWDVLEKIYAMNLPVYRYKQGSEGPAQGRSLVNNNTK